MQLRARLNLCRKPAGSLRNDCHQAKQATDERERREQTEEGADVVAGSIKRDTLQAIAQRDTEEQRGNERAHEEERVPELLPLGIMRAELEAHRTDNKTEEHEHNG